MTTAGVSVSAIRAMIVVVPVRDEEALLDRCLSAVEVAVRACRLPSVVRVVLDGCTDDSASIAARHPFPVIHVEANAVGVARRAGVESALAALRVDGGVDADRIWIAGTDADSQVPPNWLRVQQELADAGADVVLGTVRPDFADLSPRHREHWLSTHPPGRPAGNTYGANLGVRASVYLAAGGFPAAPLNEDVELVDACRRLGAATVASDAAEVLTSGRSVGRAPGGYAASVRGVARRLAHDSGGR